MECPKCKAIIKDDATVCPYCHKVLMLECPNCHALGESAVCQSCGYSILVKCSKCSKINSTNALKCSKCGFSTIASLVNQECETDEFASIVLRFNSLKTIRKLLKSQEMYLKFYNKLKNLLFSIINKHEGKVIIYDNVFVINFNKELSLATSSDKAVRLALKLLNAFSSLNLKVIEELSTPLNMNLMIVKKFAEQLLELPLYENNVKLLTIKKQQKKYLKGFQVVLDQDVWEQIRKTFKTDSLYSMEENGKSVMFYELLIESYILPPSDNSTQQEVSAKKVNISLTKNKDDELDAYSFKVFDIHAKCDFKKIPTIELVNNLEGLDIEKKGKFIALRSKDIYRSDLTEIKDWFELKNRKVLTVTCEERMSYKPWGILLEIFRNYYQIPFYKGYIDLASIDEKDKTRFKPLFDLALDVPTKAMTPEDARYTYIDLWIKFLNSLNNVVIIIDGFEKIDDTTIQTLNVLFDKPKSVKPNFVFVTDEEVSVHSKLKVLLKTPLYTEFKLIKTSIESCLSILKSDATDFIQSFYYEKIRDAFSGSYLYFKNAVDYLFETGVLIDFDNKILVKSKKSVMLPVDLFNLYRSRFKNLSKNFDASLVLAYSTIMGAKLDLKTLEKLGIKDIKAAVKFLLERNFIKLYENALEINNFSIVLPVIQQALKKDVQVFLAKTILSQLGKGLDDTTLFSTMGILQVYKEEYLTIWKNAQFAIKVGDYDAYLKNCLGFLSIVEHLGAEISKEQIEENKKEVYNNILLFLYAYSPAKIYNIENVLLMDAIESGDDEKIVKLSNLMLQGALLSSNYTDALGLLHNILSRMPSPTLLNDGKINTKFLLLSLVNIEILYNIGDYKECVEVANAILSVLSPSVLEKAKPESFSINLFVSHVLETFRLVAFAKLYLLDDDLEEYFDLIKEKLQVESSEKDVVLALKDFLAGKVYSTSNIEDYSPFSKILFLILQECSLLKDDYKKFAQNIYQAKLLASDIQQKEFELFCDLLIGYSYFKVGVQEKALLIFEDVLNIAEQSAMFSIIILANYFIAILKSASSKVEEALLLVNNSLALIQKYNNNAKVLYAIMEKLYIDILTQHNITSVDIESEAKKIEDLKEKLSVLLA